MNKHDTMKCHVLGKMGLGIGYAIDDLIFQNIEGVADILYELWEDEKIKIVNEKYYKVKWE